MLTSPRRKAEGFFDIVGISRLPDKIAFVAKAGSSEVGSDSITELSSAARRECVRVTDRRCSGMGRQRGLMWKDETQGKHDLFEI